MNLTSLTQARPGYLLGVLFFTGLVTANATFAQIESQQTSSQGIRDFAAYWSAARLLLTGNNPYSPSLALQRSIGMSEAAPLIMWNPPWCLTFLLPFGLIEFSAAQFLWLALNVALLAFSVQQLWQIYSGTNEKTRLAWLLAFTFVPAIYVLVLGQITALILFALTLFILFERERRWRMVSLILVVLTIKPQVIYLFWIAVILWIWHEKHWKILFGSAVIGLLLATIPLLFDPAVYSHYLDVLRSVKHQTPLELPAPTLRNALVVILGIKNPLLQLAPTILGAVWMLFYWSRRRNHWVWSDHLPVILIASVATSPYTWSFDQTIFLTAIIQVFTWLPRKSKYAMVGYVLFNGCYLAVRYLVQLDFWYFWTAPVFLGAYLIARHRYRNCSSDPPLQRSFELAH